MTKKLMRWREERRGAPLFYHGSSDEWYKVYDYAEASSGRLVYRANMDAFVEALAAIEEQHKAAGVSHEACDITDETETLGCYSHENFGGAFGRGEWLFVNPACDEAVNEAMKIIAALGEYPVIDDEKLDEVEYEETVSTAVEALPELGSFPGPERRKIASYIVHWSHDHNDSEDERDPGENAEEWWPSKRQLFWGYVTYRRAQRSHNES